MAGGITMKKIIALAIIALFMISLIPASFADNDKDQERAGQKLEAKNTLERNDQTRHK